MADETPQLSLIPAERPDTEVGTVPVDLIDFDPIGPEPEAALRRSIKQQGILTPLTIVPGRDGRFKLVTGRRRLLVARELKFEQVPALLVKDAGMVNVSAVTDHATRRDNPAADLFHIQALVARGASLEEIARATGLPKAKVQARMRLADLIPPLRELFDAGRVTVSVAEQAARLPGPTQGALAEKFGMTGKLTGRDVQEAKAATHGPERPMLDGFAELPEVDPTAAPAIPEAAPRLTPDLLRTVNEVALALRAEKRGGLADALMGALARAGVQTVPAELSVN